MSNPNRRALLSVSDKRGLPEMARALSAAGLSLIASGGTARAIAEAGLPVTEVSAVTGAEEILGGRVKTLHPTIAGGILSRRDAPDTATLQTHGIDPIDVVVVDLYPFAEAIARDAPSHELTEHIDIGGVTLLRAAAKNAAHVLVVPGPRHYPEVIAALETELPLLGWEGLSHLRRRMAAEAFRVTADYDTLIAEWLATEGGHEATHTSPDDLAMLAELGSLSPAQTLRYGENPHQRAGFLAPGGALPYAQHAGKALSYNNLLDLDAAWQAVTDFTDPAVVIVKHGSPCGIATGPEGTPIAELFAAALSGDPVSAFGGIVAMNRPAPADLPGALGDLFLEIVVAPAIAPEIAAALSAGRKNLRVLTMRRPARGGVTFRTAAGGLLWQERDGDPWRPDALQAANGLDADADLVALVPFAWRCVKHVKSNAIVIARRDGAIFSTAGIGGGQTNRVDAVAQAVARAREVIGGPLGGAVLASDAFFPFPDSVAIAATHEVGAIVQPGGAMRDEAVLEAAREAQIPMFLTGVRHFRH